MDVCGKILFHPAFPFFYLRVKSSFYKACLCCAGTTPSIPPKALRLKSIGKQYLAKPTSSQHFYIPEKQWMFCLLSISKTTYGNFSVKSVEANLFRPAQFQDRMSTGCGYPSSHHCAHGSTFSSAFSCSPQGAEETSLETSGISWKKKKKKKKKQTIFMHGYQVPASPSPEPLPDLGQVNWI